MKKTVEVEIEVCDLCKSDSLVYSCLHCGKDVCYECKKNGAMKVYNSGVAFTSKDGHWCRECDQALRDAKSSPLHAAYWAIARLQEEGVEIHKAFRERSEAAESHLNALLKGGNK